MQQKIHTNYKHITYTTPNASFDKLDELNKVRHPRFVARVPEMAHIFRSLPAAQMLEQLLYWHGKLNPTDGWLTKSADRLFLEAGLSRSHQLTGRRILKSAGILHEELRGCPRTLHYRIDFARFAEVVSTCKADNPKSSSAPRPVLCPEAEQAEPYRRMRRGRYDANLAVSLGLFPAILLEQLLFWHGKGSAEDGWVYKTCKELQQETGLSRAQLNTARKTLRQQALVDEKREGLPARHYFRVNIDQLIRYCRMRTTPFQEMYRRRFAGAKSSSPVCKIQHPISKKKTEEEKIKNQMREPAQPLRYDLQRHEWANLAIHLPTLKEKYPNLSISFHLCKMADHIEAKASAGIIYADQARLVDHWLSKASSYRRELLSRRTETAPVPAVTGSLEYQASVCYAGRGSSCSGGTDLKCGSCVATAAQRQRDTITAEELDALLRSHGLKR